MITKKTLALSENDAFAIYRIPNTEDIITIVQNNNRLNKFDDSVSKKEGFVFFPFNDDKNIPVFFVADKIYVNAGFEFNTTKTYTTRDITKTHYQQKATFFIDEIKSGYRKIVLSRTKSVTNKNTDLNKLFFALEEKYKNAFVFMINHPKIGTWMGATPETLISTDQNTAYTVALAGTQFLEDNRNVHWGEKEMEEQKAVMDYIETVLRNHKIKYTYRGPFTKIAAKNSKKYLLHLATEYKFDADKNILDLARQLHPTPAVSGMPKQKSIDFINQNEGYDREYYTGFLGPVNIGQSNSIQLFVNLRSMKVFKNIFLLFLGGGLNSQSVPEKEWEETENKAKTLEEVIELLQ